MTEKHLELVLETHPGVDKEHLQQCLGQQGIEVFPMSVCVLLAGQVSALRAVIPSLTGQESGKIQVPDNLKAEIKAIHIAKPYSLL